MINAVFSLFIVLLLFVFGYLGFGIFLFDKLKLKFPFLEKISLEIFVSVSLITGLIALLGQLIGTKAYLILILTSLAGFTKRKELIRYFRNLGGVIRRNRLGTIFVVASIVIFSSTIIFSSFQPDGSLLLQEVHDSVWHVALVENLQASIPPAHPADSDIVLSNYHYFYDLFLASLAYFSNISLVTLYFQFSVIFLATGLVLSAFVLGNKLNGKLSGFYLVGFTIFVGSFAYLIPYFFNPEQLWHESSFWVSQTLVMIVNPQVIYTLAVTYLTILLLNNLLQIEPKNKKYFKLNLLVIILASTSIGFKSYAWPILTSIYGLFLLVELIRYKSVRTIATGFSYLVISAPIMWLITKFNNSSFFYEPLYFTNSMIESPDRVNYLEWKFLQDHYIFKKNWPRLIWLETKKIAVFYLGNLGVRSLFLGLPLVLFFKKKWQKYPVLLFVFFGFLFSSIFPLLFLQRGTVWNSIQFWYYALIFANIMVVVLITELLKKQAPWLKILVTITIFAIAIPTSIKTIKDKTVDPEFVSAAELEYLQKLDKNDRILICPEGSRLYHTSLIKILTPADVYLANPSQLDLIGSNSEKVEKLDKIIEGSKGAELKQLIDKEKISVVLCSENNLSQKFEEMLQMESEKVGDLKVIAVEN